MVVALGAGVVATTTLGAGVVVATAEDSFSSPSSQSSSSSLGLFGVVTVEVGSAAAADEDAALEGIHSWGRLSKLSVA